MSRFSYSILNKRAVWQWIVSVVILGANSLVCFADSIPQNSRQSKVKDLKEVVVTSETRKVIPEGFAYLPTRQEKKFAYDAISLLESMDIPELDYNPANKKITTTTGENVAYYIDGKKASAQDLKGLLPKNVMRVEYLQSPSDAIFGGKQNVVNFIMKQYEYGGYTKADARQQLHSAEGNYQLFSKFQYKKLTYDAYMAGGFTNDNSLESYRLRELRGIVYNGMEYDQADIETNTLSRLLRKRNLTAALKVSGGTPLSSFAITGGMELE